LSEALEVKEADATPWTLDQVVRPQAQNATGDVGPYGDRCSHRKSKSVVPSEDD
jgi:hypothetical protein